MKDSLPRYRWVVLTLALLAQTSSAFVLQSPAPLAPLFLSELNLTKAEVGLLSSATSTGAWSIVLVAGMMADRFGVRQVLGTGLVMTGALMLSMSVVGSLYQAMAVMFLAGLCRGTSFPSSTKAVLEWFPPRARATAMGVKQLGLPVSGILAAAILPALGLALGWKMAMALPGLAIAAVGILVAILYRDPPASNQIRAAQVSTRQALGELLHNRALLILCLVAFCFLVAQLGAIAYLALYMKEVVLLAEIPDEAARIVAAGGFLAVNQIGGAAGRVGWGFISDRLFRGRRIVVLAMIGVLSTLMSFLVGNLAQNFPLGALTAIIFLYGTVIVGWNGVYNAALTETIDRNRAATGVGMSMTLTEVGTISGPPLFGLVVDLTQSFQAAWLFVAIISALGTLAALPLARAERQKPNSRLA